MGVAMIGGLGIAGLWAAGAAADEPTVGELDQKVKVIERKLENDEEAAAAKAKDSPVVTAGKDGFSLSAPDKSFQLKLGGYIQADGRFFLDDSQKKETDQLLIRRARLIVDAKFYNDFSLRLQPDFGGSSPTLQDAYLDYAPLPEFGLRAGKFKTPVGLEFLQNDSQLFFAERGLPSQLVPNRDIGFEALGSIASGTVTYAVGIFNGVPDASNGDGDNTDDKDIAGRVFLHPFRIADIDALKNFGIGIAGSIGSQTGTAASPNLPSFKTAGQNTFFSYKNSTNANGIAYADGDRTRFTPQAYYYVGPFGILGEYVSSAQEVNNGKARAKLANTGYDVQAGLVLTGEDVSFNDVVPLQNFDPANGHWGALELVARYSDLKIDGTAFSNFADPSKSASEAKEISAGLNWYLNKNVKVLLDYGVTTFTGGAAKSTDRPDEKLALARFQYAF